MPEFLTTRGVGHELEKIISESKQFLYLVSAYVHVPEGLVGDINAAIKRGVKVKLLSGKELESSNKRLERLAELNLPYEIFHHEKLHAKAYMNESKCIITSMNLVEFSEKNNEEFGVLSDNTTDIYRKLKDRVDLLFLNSRKVRVSNGVLKFDETTFKETKSKKVLNQGFCIRCSKSIPFNTKKPYCEKCYESWAEYRNRTYLEKVCHSCGKPKKDIDIDYPLCRTCE